MCTQTLKIFICSFMALVSLNGHAKYADKLNSQSCVHGLTEQPNGPFSLFIFCDDALGINIGVINTEPAAGPGNIKLTGTKSWLNWSVGDRFWQSKDWSIDVNSYYWSKDLKHLWVATSPIYGTGNIYRLDLIERKAVNLTKNLDNGGGEVSILSVDEFTDKLKVQIIVWDEDTEKSKSSTRIIDGK